jgi:hypothetical protein
MRQKRTKLNYFIIITFLIVLPLLISLGFSKLHKTDKTVFTIDNVAVTEDEFNHILQNMKALTVNYFKEKYNADYSKNFWTSRYGGENPSEYAKQKAMNYLLKIKTEQIIMKENGIIQDLSYDVINESLKKENEKRKKKIESKKPIYGPVQYNITEYYSYYQEGNRQNLVEKWSKNFENTLSDDFFKEYYEKIKNQYLKKPDSFIYEKIAINAVPNGEGILEEFKKIASTEKVTTDEAKQRTNPLINVEKGNLDPKKIKKEDPIENQLYEAFLGLNEGDFTDIFQLDQEDVIYRLIEKQNNGYENYSDVKKTVVKIYAQDQLDEQISKRLKNEKVKINHKVYDDLIVD